MREISGVRNTFTPCTIADSCRAFARCAQTRLDEHAVSTARAGPCAPNVKARRPAATDIAMPVDEKGDDASDDDCPSGGKRLAYVVQDSPTYIPSTSRLSSSNSSEYSMCAVFDRHMRCCGSTSRAS